MTGMPFVFACWVSRINLDSIFQKEFNVALKYGIDNIDNAIFQEQISSAKINYKDYLNKKISYDFNEDKKRALAFFLERINL
jgi:chorismate dehydratase